MFEYVKWITSGLIAYAVISAVSPAHSQEVKPEVKQPTVIEQKITAIKDGVVKEWDRTVAFQRKAWAYGGENTWQFINMKETVKEHWRHNAHALDTQLAQNRKQLKGYWQTIADALGSLAVDKNK